MKTPSVITKLFTPRAALKEKAIDAKGLTEALEAAEANVEALRTKISQLEDQRVDLAGEDDAARQKHRVSLTEARDDLSDAEALVVALGKRLATVSEQESQAAKQAKRAAAEDAMNTIIEGGGDKYRAGSALIVEFMRELALAEHLRQVANSDLPEGAERLPSVEDTLRGYFAQPERVLNREIEIGWARPGTGGRDRLDDGRYLVSGIREHSRQDGKLVRTGILYLQNGDEIEVEKYEYEMTEVLVFHGHHIPKSLFEEVSLPGFHAHDAAPYVPPRGSVPNASDLVRHLDELAQRTPRRPPEDRTDVRQKVIGPAGRDNSKKLFAAE